MGDTFVSSKDFLLVSVEQSQGLITNSWTFGGNSDEQASTFDMDPSGFMYVTGLARSPGMTSG